MAIQTIFKRYEFKYLLTPEQKSSILKAMAPYMQLDEYGRTTIRNIYYDTDNYRLVRTSIEAPIYKEKLRVRSYEQAAENSTVFVELKKKYDSVVYKRRLALSEAAADHWLKGISACPKNTQISREIDYFLSFYNSLKPAVFLSYEREAFFTREPSDFRVTFDEMIRCRKTELSLTEPVFGTLLLPEGTSLMEIKCSGGIPLWMVAALSENEIRKTSFSKYGTAFTNVIFPRINTSYKETLSYV